MLDTEMRTRSYALPLGHKLIAVLIAVAVGWGGYSWLSRREAQSARTAELSFDAGAARAIDPGLADAREPAVALADSFLNDQAIQGLSKQAYLASSVMNSRIGEFRSRLELRQPSPNVLEVGFRDTSLTRSEATTNAVAEALAVWKPSASATAPAAALPPATPLPSPAPAAKPATVRHPAHTGPSLSTALGTFGAQLSATNRQLQSLSETRGKTRYGRPSYNQSKQQQLLRNEIRSAQTQLDHLQVQYANETPGAGTKARLNEIRQALASVWPASRAGGHGFNAAGVSAGQLRREREELAHAINVVDRERLAIGRAEAAQRVNQSTQSSGQSTQSSSQAAQNVTESDLAAPTTPARKATGTGAGSAVESAAPASAVQRQSTSSPGAPLPWKNPLQIVRLASPASPVAPWIPAAAGVLCGLLYLGAAKLRYRSVPGDDYIIEDAAEPSQPVQRFITPDVPLRPATPVASRPADFRQEKAAAPDQETAPRQRAIFTFDPGPAESTSLPSLPDEEVPSAQPAEEHAVSETSATTSSTTLPTTALAAPPTTPFAAPPENLASSGDPLSEEGGDPVSERIRKAFSEGSIRNLFEESSMRDPDDAIVQGADRDEDSAPPDRLAG